MSKHTPGPWMAISYSQADSDIYGWNFTAAGCRLPLCDCESDDRDEIDANARLIAAAPLLLEALEGVLRVADRATDEFDAARAAIAAAKEQV